MRIRLIWLLGGVLIFAAAPASAFDLPKLLGGPGQDQQDLNTFKIIHVADLASMIENKQPDLHIYDANGVETRDKFGVIPDAVLLSSDDEYNVATTLPAKKNTPLVFYCANSH